MAITCYFASGSPFAWRVLFALGYKGLEFDSKRLDFSKGDVQSPDYLAVNPRGKVPTLVDGDLTVTESLAILAYLEEAYPETPIFGETAADTARIWQRTLEFENYFGTLVPQVARPIFTNTYEGQEKAISEKIVTLTKELATIEGWLDGSDFMGAGTPSAVDFAVYPALALVERVLGSQDIPGVEVDFLPFEEKFPAIAAWMARMEGVKGYETAYPPHWREAAE